MQTIRNDEALFNSLSISTASSLKQIGHMQIIRNDEALFNSLGISTASSLRQIGHMQTIRNDEALFNSLGISTASSLRQIGHMQSGKNYEGDRLLRKTEIFKRKLQNAVLLDDGPSVSYPKFTKQIVLTSIVKHYLPFFLPDVSPIVPSAAISFVVSQAITFPIQ